MRMAPYGLHGLEWRAIGMVDRYHSNLRFGIFDFGLNNPDAVYVSALSTVS